MKTLRNTLLLSTALMLPAAANAAWEWNWLVGGSVGYADRSADISMSFADSNVLPITEVVRNHNDSGAVWGLLGGLQAHCNGWVFGGELNVDWRDFDDPRSFAFATNAANQIAGSARFDQGTVVGISGRMGYEFLPYFMPYVRLGVETSKDELTINATDATTPTAYIAQNDKRNYRLVAGVGAEVPVPKVHGLSIRVEYNYVTKSNNSVTVAATDTLTGAFNSTGKINPRTNMGKASLVYNFL